MRDWVLLEPAQFGSVRFDATRQVLVWPLVDAGGNTLVAELPFSDFNRPAIERLEGQVAIPTGTLVVARLRDAASGVVAEPLSLIYRNPPSGSSAVDALYFDPAPQQGLLSKAVGTIRRMAAASAKAHQGADFDVLGTNPALEAFRVWLVRVAERGIGGALPRQGEDAFDSHVASLRQAGMIAFTFASSSEPFAATVIKANYMVMQYTKLLGQEAEGQGE